MTNDYWEKEHLFAAPEDVSPSVHPPTLAEFAAEVDGCRAAAAQARKDVEAALSALDERRAELRLAEAALKAEQESRRTVRR